MDKTIGLSGDWIISHSMVFVTISKLLFGQRYTFLKNGSSLEICAPTPLKFLERPCYLSTLPPCLQGLPLSALQVVERMSEPVLCWLLPGVHFWGEELGRGYPTLLLFPGRSQLSHTATHGSQLPKFSLGWGKSW